jgi:hypothetical protein
VAELVSIPPLKNFQYQESGFTVPADFTRAFVRLHGDNWGAAERDWEDIVAVVLDTDAVAKWARGHDAIKQAVEAAAAFMMDDELWPWCPICKRGTALWREEEIDGR